MNITYRKKPVVIEAMKWDGTVESTRAIIEWSDDAVRHANQTDILQIETLEGVMRADVGDFIIKGVKGEFYPCKSDIFEATYERVAEDERTDPVSEVRGDEAP